MATFLMTLADCDRDVQPLVIGREHVLDEVSRVIQTSVITQLLHTLMHTPITHAIPTVKIYYTMITICQVTLLCTKHISTEYTLLEHTHQWPRLTTDPLVLATLTWMRETMTQSQSHSGSNSFSWLLVSVAPWQVHLAGERLHSAETTPVTCKPFLQWYLQLKLI